MNPYGVVSISKKNISNPEIEDEDQESEEEEEDDITKDAMITVRSYHQTLISLLPYAWICPNLMFHLVFFF